METAALSTDLGHGEELVEGLGDLLHQVQQLQISVPGGQRGGEPGVEAQAEQQGPGGWRLDPHDRLTHTASHRQEQKKTETRSRARATSASIAPEDAHFTSGLDRQNKILLSPPC